MSDPRITDAGTTWLSRHLGARPVHDTATMPPAALEAVLRAWLGRAVAGGATARACWLDIAAVAIARIEQIDMAALTADEIAALRRTAAIELQVNPPAIGVDPSFDPAVGSFSRLPYRDD